MRSGESFSPLVLERRSFTDDQKISRQESQYAPIIGDDHYIEVELIGRVESSPNMSVPKRLALDAKLRRAALRKGFDSIVLLTPTAIDNSRMIAEFLEAWN